MDKLHLSVLYLISFLDSLCFGLIMPILPPYILSIGGTHTILGVLATSHVALQQLAGPLTRTYSESNGRKSTLTVTLFIGAVTHLTMGLVPWYAAIIGLRLVFCATNQTQTLCKAFVAEHEAKERHNSVYTAMGVFGVLGFIVGPVIGGHIFEMENGFYYLCCLTSLIMVACILLSVPLPHTIPEQKPVKGKKEGSPAKGRRTSFLQKIRESVTASTDTLKKVKLASQWPTILMKVLTTVSLTAFFMKFSLLLKVHYNLSHSYVGYTVAYQSVLVFLSSFLVPIARKIYGVRSTLKLLHCLSLSAVTIAAACYSPTYVMYLASFIPVSFAKSALDAAWQDFVEADQENKDIGQIAETVSALTGLLTPLVFGVACDVYTHNAVKGFSIVPLVLASFVGAKFVRRSRPSFKGD